MTKLVAGLGVFDLKGDPSYVSQWRDDSGNHHFSPCYLQWYNMIRRVTKPRYSCYDDATICDEWITFSNFKEWFDSHYIEGFHLDKDLLGDSKEYSPSNCCFLPPVINAFITNRQSTGLLGARRKGNRYESRVHNPMSGKSEYLGMFATESEAHLVWKRRKIQLAIELSELYSDCLSDEAKDALVSRFTTETFLAP